MRYRDLGKIKDLVRDHKRKYKGLNVKMAYVIIGQNSSRRYLRKVLLKAGYEKERAAEIALNVSKGNTIIAECHLERAELIAERIREAGPKLKLAVTIANP